MKIWHKRSLIDSLNMDTLFIDIGALNLEIAVFKNRIVG